MSEQAQAMSRLFDPTLAKLKARLDIAVDARAPAETMLMATAAELVNPRDALEVIAVSDLEVDAAAERLAAGSPRVFRLSADRPAPGSAEDRRKELKRRGIL